MINMQELKQRELDRLAEEKLRFNRELDRLSHLIYLQKQEMSEEASRVKQEWQNEQDRIAEIIYREKSQMFIYPVKQLYNYSKN